ncbi:phage tail protein [Stenotrophomonas maltophilia]|uniref:host specificity factor TipJ family phage tail protein n=1 Tax=Stenotrophomonas maltophilia TaxID=40324 RepID=UPI0012B0E6B8|nr:host specificity factor TipJ family phage tail protein [Stenotrophomonas maltophilia]QGL94560.1 phage tail protein [Stenotrophomonas maltophilia]
MGLMLPSTDPGRLIITPHPVMLDGQQNLEADLRPGESLYGFLARHVHGLDGQAWLVTIGGRPVERHLWCHVYPKHGQVIEIRGVVGRSAIRLVAMIALTYFTLGGAAIAGFSIGTSTVLGTAIARVAVYVAGSILINKVLGPKLPKAAEITPADTVFSLSAPRNRSRAYEPLPLLFGSVRVAPDVASKPYMNYEGDEQYLSLLLTPGLNVGRVEAIYNGDALLSSYEGVQVWYNGFPGMPNQAIPLYSNAGSVDGGVIYDTSSDPKHTPSKWVQRTSSPGAIRLQVNIDFRIFDADSKGREYENREQIQIQYRAVGESAWRPFGTYAVSGRTQKSRRATYGLDVAPGQYEVQVRTTGQNTDGNNAQASFTWTNLVSVLPDTASYDGIPRIGIRMKASGQLNGSPDEVRTVAHAQPIPVWKGDAIGWVTEESSNPGAQILAYARGIKSPAGVRIAGMGLPDSQIDVDSLKAFTLHCAANGFTYDYLVTDKRNHQAVMDAIALAGFGQIAWPKGRLAVTWAADEQPLSGVVNMATIKKGQFQVEYTLANGADGIEYSYLDRATWEARTLRVPAPGVTTMLNPAQVTGEGVTSEAHAATLARWHLAQSLYQYKSISYSTDIEHLAYGRMSVLALQHDLTQWGFGGQVLSATMGPGRAVTLQLDVPVPGRAQASAYIGLRIPGERVYRVLKVVPFTGESDQLQLAEPWPADAALPGDSEGNPAWDTIWIYDFKQTPGYRVRVVSVQPENDLKGAAVDVVAEGPEFWHYVKTGHYIPPESGSQLATRPVASNLRITERQIVQGDTVFSELQASFDITGPVGEIRVLSDVDRNGELEQVASTSTRTASWRIPGAGVYPITVRPYNPDGLAGVAVTGTYTTRSAGAPPVLVDLFDVDERTGGVRLYTWGWLDGTAQSPDFAGVEIRYTEGNVLAPDWNAMMPVGQSGFHTAPFEAVVPASGHWTFACRSRNTSGDLSVAMQVIRKELRANLGEVIGGIEEGLGEQGRNLAKEISDRMDAVLAEAAARTEGLSKAAQALAAEASARAQAVEDAMDAVSAEARARVDAILNEKLAREADISREQQIRQSADESLARAVSEVAAGSGTQFDSIKLWPFNQNTEGWTGNGSPTLVDGWLRPADHTTAPWVQSPAALVVDGSAYRFVKLRVKRVGTPTWAGVLQWTTATDKTWNTQKHAAIPEPAWDVNGVATVDVQDIAWWPATVDAIRLQLGTAQTVANYYLIDYIAVGRPQPGASVALVQEETQARITADAAEALQRNTLAVQMRGNYTGTDPLQLTSGLAYEELKARVAADTAQVQRISTMEARMPAGAGSLATAASVTALQEATATTTSALAQSITTINATLPAMISQGSNMVLNGSWQAGKDVGWTYDPGATGTSWPATEGRAGGMCVRFDPATIRQKVAYANGRTTISTSPGKKYRYSCWYRSTPDFNGTSGNSKMRLANQNGELIGGATFFVADKAAWTYLSAVYAIPDNTSITGLQLGIYADNTAGTLWVDDVVLEEVTELLANAQAISDLSTKVTQQGETITSQAGLLTALRSDLTNVSGKTDANTVALTQLTSRTTAVEGQVETIGTSVTKLEGQIQSVGGDNLLWNSSMEEGTPSGVNPPAGWNLERIRSDVGGTLSAVDSALSGGGKAVRIEWTAINAKDWVGLNRAGPGSNYAKVDPNTDYTLSSWVRGTAGTKVQIYVQWMNDSGGTVLGTVTLPEVVMTSQWQRLILPARSRGDAVRARVYVGRQFADQAGSYWLEIDNVQFQRGLVATEYRPSGQEAINVTTQNVSAVSGLTTRMVNAENKATAQADQLAVLSSTLNASFNRGENLNVNAMFDGDMAPFVKGNSNQQNGDVTWISGGGQQGSAIQMVHKAGAAGSPFVYANGNRWVPLKTGRTGRKLRTVIVAKVVAGDATLTARCRVRHSAGEGNNDQTTPNLTSAWQRFVLEHPVGDDRTEAMSQVWITNRGTGDATVLVDRIEFYDVTDELLISATASATAGLTTAVNQQGSKLDATAQDLVSLKTQVGDVSASGFNQLKTQVTQQGQTQASQAQQITGIQTSLGGKADAAVVQQMEASIGVTGGSPNLLRNAAFTSFDGWDGWYSPGNIGIGAKYAAHFTTDGGIPWGMWGLIFVGANGAGNALVWQQDVPIEAGKDYIFSTYGSGSMWGLELVMVFLNASGNSVGEARSPMLKPLPAGGNTLSGYSRLWVRGRAPSDAVAVRPHFVYSVGPGETGGFIRIVQPQLEAATPGQTGPSAFNIGGMESKASWNVSVRSDGKVAGLRLATSNGVSAFDVVADVFRVSSSGAGQRTEFSDGHWRCFYPNGQLATRVGYWP